MTRGFAVWTLGTLLACSSHAGAPAERPAQEVAVPAVPVPAIAEPAPEAIRAPAPTSTNWVPLEVVPGCTVTIADAPAALGQPIEWQPCADKAEGCRELVAVNKDAIGANRAIDGLAHGDRVTVAVMTFSPGPRARYVLAPRDGLPFFAVEGPRETQCSLAQIGLSDDGAVIEITFDNEDGYASRAYLRGPLHDDPAWHKVAAVLPRKQFPDFIGESAFSAGGRVVVEQNGGPLRWWDANAARWVEVPGSKDGWSCCASGHGDSVSFLIETIPEQAKIARLGERAHALHRGPVAGTSPVQIDGTRAVWLEGTRRDNNNIYQSIALWTADVTPELTLVNRRQVTRVPRTTMTEPKFGGGMVAVFTQEDARALTIYGLDGAPDRVLRPAKGLMVERLLWITADEVAVMIGPGGRHAEPSATRRFSLASLPPV